VVALIRALHPQIKRKLRFALDDILAGRESGKALRDELAGQYSLRIGKFRLIYRAAASGDIEVLAFGSRSTIYEETLRRVRRERRIRN
jgi:mRNA interferase RelE/StbE